MTKKYLSILLVILLVFSLIPLNSFAEEVETEPAEEAIEVTEAEEVLPPEDETEVSEEDQAVSPMADEPVSMAIDGAAAVMYASLEEALAALALNGPATAEIVITGPTSSTTPQAFAGYQITMSGTAKQAVNLAPLNIIGGSLVVKNLSVTMKPVVGTSWTLMLGNASSGDTSVTFDNVTLRMEGGQTDFAHAIHLQSRAGASNTLNFINGTHATITGYISSGTRGNAIYTESEATHIINITDSQLYSLANRSGFVAGTYHTYVNLTNGLFHTLDSLGNGSNGGHVTAINSDINFSGSVNHGLSVISLKLTDSKIVADKNGANGIHVNGGGFIAENSEIYVSDNAVSLASQWTIPGAVYIRGNENSFDENTVVVITGNAGPGLHLNTGSLNIASKDFTVMYNTAHRVNLVEGRYARGAGIYVTAGSLVLPEGAKIYNNRASIEADDIFVAEGAQLTLYPVGMDWILEESPEWAENHLIDGWYHDAADKRWSAHIDPIYVNELAALGALEGPLTLKAAHTQLIDIPVEKIWVDGPEVKPTITIHLLADGEVVASADLDNGVTEHIFKNLPKFDTDREIVYSLLEDALENYETEIEPDEETGGFVITNTYVSPKIDVTATKTWIGGPADKPDIRLQLMKNGEAFGDPEVLKHPAVSYTWKELDQTTANGEPIVYTVDEIDVPQGYVKTASGLEVTNTFMMVKTDITATKKWVGGSDKKPVIQLQLYRDGEAFGDVVELDGVTTYTWKDLDKHSSEGKVYVYTVKETVVPNNYKATYSEDGLTITNTWTKQEPPNTGMGSSTWMMLILSTWMLSLGGLLLIGGAAVFLRKKQNGNAS